MKLGITRRLATAVAMAAVVAASTAAPVYGEPPAPGAAFNGSYTGGDAANVWIVTTQCQTEGCTGTVASNQGWSAPAKMVHGLWHFIVTKPDGVICNDGSYAPAYIEFEVDPVTLNGTLTTDDNYSCPGGVITTVPIALTKVG